MGPSAFNIVLSEPRWANPRTADSEGWTAIAFAANEGHAAMVEYLANVLLQKGMDLKEVVDFEGCSPMHYAASGGHVDAIKALVAKGFDVNAQDNEGMTPCMNAAQ